MARDYEKKLEWQRKKMMNCGIYLNRDHDKEIIEFLKEKPNRRKYILELIKADMEKEKALDI